VLIPRRLRRNEKYKVYQGTTAIYGRKMHFLELVITGDKVTCTLLKQKNKVILNNFIKKNRQITLNKLLKMDYKKKERNILATARKIFLEKGYSGASITVIAISANIEKNLLYDYFRSKNHLYYIIFDEAFLHLYEKIVRAFADEKLYIFTKIRRIVDDFISFFNDNPDLLTFMINESMRHPERIGKRVGAINSI